MARRKTPVDEVVEQVQNRGNHDPAPIIPPSYVSTGSTLLDLAISGKRIRGGGIPGGIIVEIYGPSGAGKTALLSEIAASAQVRNGTVQYLDPEARLDIEYQRLFGVSISEDQYHRPNTVKEMFQFIWTWDTENAGNAVNVICADSLAALSTEIEMNGEDKMGMKRAKDFSEGLRKTARILAAQNKLLVCTNQVREGEMGKVVTPGGKAIPFYCSVRIEVRPDIIKWKLEKEKQIGKKTIKKQYGIRSTCTIKKNSIDDPYRSAPLSIVFGQGIDTIRDELQWYKELTSDAKYLAIDKECSRIDDAISHIEENNLEDVLRERTIEKWLEVEDAFAQNRKPKVRR